jgi:hypothetical protein
MNNILIYDVLLSFENNFYSYPYDIYNQILDQTFNLLYDLNKNIYNVNYQDAELDSMNEYFIYFLNSGESTNNIINQVSEIKVSSDLVNPPVSKLFEILKIYMQHYHILNYFMYILNSVNYDKSHEKYENFYMVVIDLHNKIYNDLNHIFGDKLIQIDPNDPKYDQDKTHRHVLKKMIDKIEFVTEVEKINSFYDYSMNRLNPDGLYALYIRRFNSYTDRYKIDPNKYIKTASEYR